MLLYPLLCWIIMLAVAVVSSNDRQLTQRYNCLHLYDDVQIQLNTHITRHIRTHTFSPDGNYLVGSIEHTDYSELFIETVATGQRVTLQNHVVWGHQIEWSPDSQLLFYTWMDDLGKFHANLVTVHGESIDEKMSDELPRLLDFSPDGQYFSIAEPSIGITLFARHDPQHPLLTGPFDLWAYQHDRAAGQYWSPDGERLAYITESELVVINISTLTLQQISLPNPIPRVLYSVEMAIRWSPDGQRLLIEHWNWGQSEYGVYLFDVTDSAIKIIPPNFPGSTSAEIRFARWVSHTELVYLIRRDTGYMEIQRYDTETQRSATVVANVECATVNNQTFTLAYREGSYVVAEVRAAEGFNPVFRRTLQIEESLLDCSRRDTPYAQTMSFSIPKKGRIILIVTDDPDTTLWIAQSLEVAQTNNILWGHYYGRFVLLGSPEGNDATIIDLKTHQFHRLPAEINPMKPDTRWDYWYDLKIFPSPDESNWLVLLNGRLYRYWPAEDRWEPDPIIETDILDVLWSPDSQRYAVLTAHHNLYVYGTNGHYRWSLGTFWLIYFFRKDSIHWSQCGDILAPLRDYLAAERVKPSGM
jgi:hypothetical protein